MKAISIDSEYVIQMIDGEKTEEYRTWPTSYRGEIIICATGDSMWRGAAYLSAELYGCVKEGDIYAFKLRNFRGLRPFVVKGQQRIYNIEPSEPLEYWPMNEDQSMMTVDEEIEFMKKLRKKPFTDKEIEELRSEIENRAADDKEMAEIEA
jgi:hypothetical protein